jgi:hypothetical protein
MLFAGCEGPAGPQGAAGINAGEGPFGFAIDGGSLQEVKGLAPFSAALQAALEEQPGGKSADRPIALKVTGLNLSRKEELVALYAALTRYVDLDLGGCTGITLADTAVFPENRAKIVSRKLPDTISQPRAAPARLRCPA